MNGKGSIRPIVPETLDEKGYGNAFQSEKLWYRIHSRNQYKVRVHHDSNT